MTCITREQKKQDITRAFDEAVDAIRAGDPDRAEYLLDRALPKPQSRHVLEAILTTQTTGKS